MEVVTSILLEYDVGRDLQEGGYSGEKSERTCSVAPHKLLLLLRAWMLILALLHTERVISYLLRFRRISATVLLLLLYKFLSLFRISLIVSCEGCPLLPQTFLG